MTTTQPGSFQMALDQVIKIIDQIIPQVGIWNDQIMRTNMTSNKILLCSRVKMLLIACKDHNHPRINGEIDENEKDLFSVFYLSSQLKECEFTKYIKYVLEKFPDQKEQAEKMTALFTKLSPLLT